MNARKQDFLIENVDDISVLERSNEELFADKSCLYLLLICKEQYEVKILFLSRSKLVRAVEILEFMLSEFGLVKGDASRANACISQAILNSLVTDAEFSTEAMYFDSLIDSYLEDTAFIMAYDFARENADVIYSLPLYVKRKVKWAVVKSVDIVNAGESFIIKSLENESGEAVVASDNSYIMVGCRGEIYEITKDKFDKSYEMSDEKLDVFEQMLDFIPEVKNCKTGEYVSIDDRAHICYPKQDAKIYAMRLNYRTKIFQRDGDGEYFLGRPGDYMAVRADDIGDMYIIQKDVFEYTYEMI